MKSIKIPEIEINPAKPFEYKFQETITIDDIEFHHVGWGLYASSVIAGYSEDGFAKLLNKYPNFKFVYLTGYNVEQKIALANAFDTDFPVDKYVCFALSSNYSQWDDFTLEECLSENPEVFNIPRWFQTAFNKIVALTDKYPTVLGIYSSYEDAHVDSLDTPFVYSSAPLNEKDYIRIGNKVGRRIRPLTFEFKDPLPYRSWHSRHAGDLILEGAIDIKTDVPLFVLYEQLPASSFSIEIARFKVHYTGFDEQEIKELQKIVGFQLEKIEPTVPDDFETGDNRSVDYLTQAEIEELLSGPTNSHEEPTEEEEDPQPIIPDSAVPVFEGADYKQDWRVQFTPLFHRKIRELKEVNYCWFEDDDLVVFHKQTLIKINPSVCRYLRVAYKKDGRYVGATLVNDETAELNALGDRDMQQWKEIHQLYDKQYWNYVSDV